MDSGHGLASISVGELATGEIAFQVRKAVNGILEKELENAVRLISDNKDRLDGPVNELLKKNRIAEKEIDVLPSE